MIQQCANCSYFNVMQTSDPGHGWCDFMLSGRVPFWMENCATHIDKLGAEVAETDGAECSAFTQEKHGD